LVGTFLVQVAEFLPGECSGLIHGPGRHDEVGMVVAFVLPARLVDRYVKGHPETLAEEIGELAHCLPHLVRGCLMRECNRERPGDCRILSPLRSLGGVP
jgi:hypothetical protein